VSDSHSISFQVSGLTGRDAFWAWVLPERWAARYVAKKLLAEAHKGARFTEESPFILKMPNGRTWEVFHAQRWTFFSWRLTERLVLRHAARRHALPPGGA